MIKEVKEILRKAEAQILDNCGLTIKLSVDYVLPEYVQESLLSIYEKLGVRQSDVLEGKRTNELVTMRQIVSLFLKKECDFTCTAIAKYLGQDHTTVLYNIKRAEEYLHNNDRLFMKYYNPVKHLFDEKI